MTSKVANVHLNALNPTLNYQAGNIASLPLLQIDETVLFNNVNDCINIAKRDWDTFETSWDFIELPFLQSKNGKNPVSGSEDYRKHCRRMTDQMKQLEKENNNIFIEAYGLQDELLPEVPIEEITLFANPKYRYRGELTDDELEVRFKADTVKELISYSIGCMMGRYSLDKPGLIYAHSGNEGVDPSQYKTFPADDDAACRFFRFIETAWDKKGLDANLDFIFEAIGSKSGESSREAIRRYFVNDFYKDHCHTYKKRPIYWLFKSGKEKAFQALVYLHRYNEGTLSRMRTEYVLPLQTKINRHIKHLEKDKDNAASTRAANKIQKEITSLLKSRKRS